jgi:CHAT domain-containing protein
MLEHAERALADAAASLDEGVLQPLLLWLQDRPVVVVPTAKLHALPWALLPSFRKRPVAVAPSATWWLRAARRQRDQDSPLRTVLVSGPDLLTGPVEVADLVQVYPHATYLAGSAASAAAVGEAMDGADTVHVAAHGTFRADQPLLSSIRLADGPLTVYDLERLGRAPRLLVLACCEAGLTDVLPGDEVMGLAASVLALGTTSLVAPIMSVRDDETHEVMLALHRRLAAGETPAAALAAVLADAERRHNAVAFACLGAG